MKPLIALLTLIFALITGCAVALGTTVTNSDVEAKYGSATPHWIGDPVKIDQILILGSVVDPETTHGNLLPDGSPSGLDPRWFNIVGLNRVDVYEVPIFPSDQTWEFGPKRGQPVGVYAYERHIDGALECSEYDRATRSGADHFQNPFHPYSPILPIGECLTYKYIGPVSKYSPKYISITYSDNQFQADGFGVILNEIRDRSKKVLAASHFCFSNLSLRQIKHCEGVDSLFGLFEHESNNKKGGHAPIPRPVE